MNSGQRYSSKRAYIKGSSTRATLRESNQNRDMMIKGLRRKLKEQNDIIKDLKNLVELNKQAMLLCVTNEKDPKLTGPLKKENKILLEGLFRNFTFQEKFGLMVERYKTMMEEVENRLKLLQGDMAERMGKLMVKLAYYEKECRYEEMAVNFCEDLENINARQELVEATKNFNDNIRMAVVWRERAEKLKMEKKELLRVNFELSSEIMKMKALLSTSKGYKDFMNQNRELMPENIKENFEKQVNKIISFHKKYLKNKPEESDEEFEGDDDNDDDLSSNYEVFDTEMMDETMPLETEDAGAFNNKKSKPNFSLAIPKHSEQNFTTNPNSKNAALSFKLDLSKAMDMQERMTKKMMDKAIKEKNKNRTRLEKAEIIQEKFDKLDKEHTRILKLLNDEMENSQILNVDNRRLKKMNQELLNVNQILIQTNKKCEKRRRMLEKNVLIFRRAYMAFNFFVSKTKGDFTPDEFDDHNQFVLGILNDLSSKYDPDRDYTFRENNQKEKKIEPELVKKKIGGIDLGRAKALATHIHTDVSNNKLIKKVELGHTLMPSHRNEGRTRSYSFKGENLEDMKEKFDQKMKEEDKGNLSFED